MQRLHSQIWRTLRERPLHLAEYARRYWLFERTRILRRLLPGWFGEPAGIYLGPNTRVQRLRVLRAERPSARIQVGNHSIIYENARIEAYGQGQILIGSCTVFGDVRIVARESVRIGDRVVSSWNVFIQDFDPHPVEPEQRALQIHNLCAGFHPGAGNLPPRPLPAGQSSIAFPTQPIEIGDDVWIGANAIILKGARIGRGSIVAAGAVVTAGNWPERSVLAGSPARIVRTIEAAPV